MNYQDRIGKAVSANPTLFPATDPTVPDVKHQAGCAHATGGQCNCESTITFECKGKSYQILGDGAVLQLPAGAVATS